MILPDKQDSNGMWLKCYTVGGVSHKTRAYRLWLNLEARTNNRHKDKCYAEATNEFKDFQDFADWCQTQHGYTFKEDNGYYWQLDKDVLGDSKVYSKDTCVFIPNKINSVLVEHESQLGLSKGVALSKNGQRYMAKCRDASGVKQYLGTFDTDLEAHQVYLKFKKEVVMEVLQKYDLGENVVKALKVRWNI